MLGHYPEDGLELFQDDVPKFTEDDMRTIHQPLDFYGVNIYSGGKVKAGADGNPELVPFPAGHPQTFFGWKVTPEALYWGPRLIFERYKTPIVVTENGMSNVDSVMADGRVRDQQRIDFLRAYLCEYARAAADGVELWGYFVWSILDNFEWAEGYKHRFGLVHVNFQTQERTLKDSAQWYRRVIHSRGEALKLNAIA
jgi:beta-glucosidase